MRTPRDPRIPLPGLPWVAPYINQTEGWISYAACSVQVPNETPEHEDCTISPVRAGSGGPATSRQGAALSRGQSDAVAGFRSTQLGHTSSDSLRCIVNVVTVGQVRPFTVRLGPMVASERGGTGSAGWFRVPAPWGSSSPQPRSSSLAGVACVGPVGGMRWQVTRVMSVARSPSTSAQHPFGPSSWQRLDRRWCGRAPRPRRGWVGTVGYVVLSVGASLRRGHLWSGLPPVGRESGGAGTMSSCDGSGGHGRGRRAAAGSVRRRR